MHKIQSIIRHEFGDSFAVCGFLRAPVAEEQRETSYSDVDLFLLQAGGTPSDYFDLATRVLDSLAIMDSPCIIFASFRQQMLLRSLALHSRPMMLHYLHYLSPRHLVSREINTLPLFGLRNIDPIRPVDRDTMNQIASLYTARAAILHPSWLRFYYYFDIANEALPMIANIQSGQLCSDVMIHELVHKLKFLTKYLGLEITAEHQRAADDPSSEDVSTALNAMGFQRLVTLSAMVKAVVTASSAPALDWVLDQFRELYRCFDRIECLSDLRLIGGKS